jgi:hypothetical protein
MLPEGVMVARVIKRYARRRVVEIVREVVRGPQAAVQERLMETQRCVTALINNAYIERLNATFRAHLAPLARRTRAGVHQQATLEAGMWLVGCCYTSCGCIKACAESATMSAPIHLEEGDGLSEPRPRRRVLRIIAGRWRSY